MEVVRELSGLCQRTFRKPAVGEAVTAFGQLATLTGNEQFVTLGESLTQRNLSLK
jgi:hypothetical protein